MLYVRNVRKAKHLIRDNSISSERFLRKDYYRKSSVKKSLVVSLKGLDAKTNWFMVNHQS
jgi:hypothetical protein